VRGFLFYGFGRKKWLKEDEMIHLNLNIEEREAIINVLESYLSNLRYEIADTDSMEFRNGLKEKKV